MSIGKTVLIAFLLAAALWVAAPAGRAGEPSPCDYREFGLDASKFFLYLTKDTPYTGWSLWPGRSAMGPAGSPHGPRVVAYVNPAARESILRKGGMVFGSLIVLENRAADGRLTSLDARIKIKGYHPEGGDWYWFRFSPDGKAMAEGKAPSCLACHGQARDNDFTMTAPVQ